MYSVGAQLADTLAGIRADGLYKPERLISSAHLVPSSFFDARVTASTCSALIAPSSNASARFGVASNVLERSVVFAA